MKRTVSLCGGKCCCPVVEIEGAGVRIGEDGNLCVLKRDEWNAMVDKIRSGELTKI